MGNICFSSNRIYLVNETWWHEARRKDGIIDVWIELFLCIVKHIILYALATCIGIGHINFHWAAVRCAKKKQNAIWFPMTASTGLQKCICVLLLLLLFWFPAVHVFCAIVCTQLILLSNMGHTISCNLCLIFIYRAAVHYYYARILSFWMCLFSDIYFLFF